MCIRDSTHTHLNVSVHCTVGGGLMYCILSERVRGEARAHACAHSQGVNRRTPYLAVHTLADKAILHC